MADENAINDIIEAVKGQQTLLQRIGSMFYIVDPKASLYQYASDVPNYIHEVGLLFFAAMLAEAFIRRYIQGKEVRFNEAICSVCVGILHEATVFVSGTIMLLGYEWLYQYRMFDLPWDCIYTWFATLLFVDFCYYWIHRANHEINFLWAAHQLHHSSEDYNLTMGVRASMFQRAASFGFYQSLALIGFPYPMALVHVGLNFLVQYWVHTDIVRSIGPFEHIFMTPSHHKVHHGSNKWCLDKNYGGLFIVWDKLFGTFEAERKDEEIVYGLTAQPMSHNAVYLEFYYFRHLYNKVKSMSTWGDRLRALLYGPGWVPGAPRLGDPDTFPDIKAPRPKYNPVLPMWKAWYIMIHMGVVFIVQQTLVHQQSGSSWFTIITFLLCIFVSIGVFGGLVDNRWWAPLFEAARCAYFVAYVSYKPLTPFHVIDTALFTYFGASMMLWMILSIQILSSTLQISYKTSKLE